MTQKKLAKSAPKRRIISAPLVPNRGDELAYARRLASLCRPMLKKVYAETVKAYRESAIAVAIKKISMDSAVDDLFLLLEDMQDIFQDEFDTMALPMAEEMVEKQFANSARDFARITKQMVSQTTAPTDPAMSAGGISVSVDPGAAQSVNIVKTALNAGSFAIPGSIFDISPQMSVALKASIQENVSLIKSIPPQFFDRVAGAVTRSMQAGGSVKQLAEELKQYALMTDRRAKNIAMDQTRKTYAALNLRRMQDAGVKKFKWSHTGGSVKPREFHLAPYPEGLNGGIFSIEDPPVIEPNSGITGFPAQLPFCRCTMQAVIELDD